MSSEPNPTPAPSEPPASPPERMTGILAILLAVLLFVSAVSVFVIAQGRNTQAALLNPPATATVRTGQSPASLATRPAGGQTAATATKPAGTAVSGAATAGQPTRSASSPATTGVPGTQSAGQATAAALATRAATSQPTVAAQAQATRPATNQPTTATQPGQATATRPAGTTAAPSPATGATAGATPGTPAAAAKTTWYFAEGSTGSPFQTTYAIFNAGTQPAQATVTLYTQSATTLQRNVTVQPGSQVNVSANEIMANLSIAVGAGISSDQPIYVQRSVLGVRDGTSAPATQPAKVWYFPEAQTDTDFTSWFQVLNPNSAPSTITATYYPVGAAKAGPFSYTVPANARMSIYANTNVASGVMGVVLESSLPIIAEESIFFDDQKAAYGDPGISTLSKTWYIAAGNTQDKFVSRVALFNPGTAKATVKASFVPSQAAPTTQTYTLEAQSKDDIVLNDIADGQFVALTLSSDQPIAAELVTYYYSGGETDPIAAYGMVPAPQLSTQWFLPQMTSNADVNSFLGLFNPGTTVAKVTVSYLIDGGAAVSKTYDLAMMGRTTLNVSAENSGKSVFGVIVSSTQPIVADRYSMFLKSVGATGSAGELPH